MKEGKWSSNSCNQSLYLFSERREKRKGTVYKEWGEKGGG